MFTLYLFCAVIAGSLFLLQFAMLLIGFGGEGGDFDVDLPDAGDVDFDISDAGDFDTEGVHDHGSTWLFGIISLRTMVAAVTFFGLGGLAMQSADFGPLYSMPVAITAGAAAMFVVHFLMRSLHQLSQDGKLRIQNAVGRTGTVYVPIAAHNESAGKIQVRMQGRLAELAAMNGTSETLSTGTRVRVVGIVTGSTVQVEPIVAKHEDETPKKEEATT